MKCCKIIKVMTALMVFASMLCHFSSAVSAEEKRGRITLDFRAFEGLDTEMRWDIFKVADIIDAETFEITEEFREYPIKFDISTKEALNSLAYTLSYYAISESLEPYCSKSCMPDDMLIAENLPQGFYLIQSGQVEYNSFVYSSAPVVVCVADGEVYGTDWQLDITVVPKLGLVCSGAASDKISCVVKAKFTNTEETHDVKVSLFKDGVIYDTIILNAANEWQYVWPELDNKNEWTIIENDLPENFFVNFEMEYLDAEGRGVKYFEITNSYKDKVTTTAPPATTTIQTTTTAQKLPQTGMLLWPIPVLSLLGIILIAAGSLMLRKKTQ